MPRTLISTNKNDLTVTQIKPYLKKTKEVAHMIPKDHFFYFRAMYLISKHVTNLFSTQFIEILLYYALQETLLFLMECLIFVQ